MRVAVLRACTFVVVSSSLTTIQSSRLGAQMAPRAWFAQAVQSARPVPSAPAVQAAQRIVPQLIDLLPLTRIEALLGTTGVVVAADYYPIDMRFGPGLSVDAVVVTSTESRDRLRGLRIQVSDDHRPNPREEATFLDFEEVSSLSRSLSTMIERTSKWTGRDAQRNTEVSYVSNAGFRLTIHQSIRTQRVSAFTGVLDPVGTSIDVTELPALKEAIDQALALLTAK